MAHGVVFTAPREVQVQSEDVTDPAADQVLVRTRRSLISAGTETIVLSGRAAPGSKWAAYGRFPFKAGYSNAGEIVAVGSAVEGWPVGDRVVSGAPHVSYHLQRQRDLLGRV